jgi:hypothetical protein
MDEHVPSAITEGLRARHVDVLTVQEDGRDGSPDPKLLDRAAALDRIIFTRDDDFLKEATRRQRANEAFRGVIYGHQLGPSTRRCIDELQVFALATDLFDWDSRVEYLA